MLEFGTQYYWKIIAEDDQGDSTEGPIWTFTTKNEPVPNLDCSGTLSWTNVTPGGSVSGSITVSNIGDPESILDWEVLSFPLWGDWTFTPESGTNLEEGDSISIDVDVVAPDEEEEDFEGEVVLVNSEDPGDTCSIDVSLATPISQISTMRMLQRLNEKYPKVCTILRILLET
jgi:hypothetical protein